MRRLAVSPPMGQVVGGWIGAMIVLGIAGGWLFGPAEVTLHTVPAGPRPVTSTTRPLTSSVAGSIGATQLGRHGARGSDRPDGSGVAGERAQQARAAQPDEPGR